MRHVTTSMPALGGLLQSPDPMPPQQSRMNEESLIDRRSVSPRGDAFEMVLLALREKARAAKWVRSTVGSGFWT